MVVVNEAASGHRWPLLRHQPFLQSQLFGGLEDPLNVPPFQSFGEDKSMHQPHAMAASGTMELPACH